MIARRPILGIAASAATVCIALLFCPSHLPAEETWTPTGSYRFTGWSGPPLTVYYSVPPGSDAQTSILIVMPGAKRQAELCRDQWDHLAVANGFITLVIEAAAADFPTEYDYNLGGVINADGQVQPREQWLFSAIDPIFSEFQQRFGSSRNTYSLYGHSAGGGFVHLFLLMMPAAKVERAVAANPAFCTLPDATVDFPFGLRGLALPEKAIQRWFAKPLTILLGDRDLEPRAYALSSSAAARLQGPHVFSRGLGFFRGALCAADAQNVPLRWQLEIVHNVGHSNTHMAAYAVKHLFDD